MFVTSKRHAQAIRAVVVALDNLTFAQDQIISQLNGLDSLVAAALSNGKQNRHEHGPALNDLYGQLAGLQSKIDKQQNEIADLTEQAKVHRKVTDMFMEYLNITVDVTPATKASCKFVKKGKSNGTQRGS